MVPSESKSPQESAPAPVAPADHIPDGRVPFAHTLEVELFELGISKSAPKPSGAADDTVYDRAKAAKLCGLALSGGGIRSATFNLGVLQSLATNSDLSLFHYLSTVSGGGYIGMWLSAFVHRITAGNIERAEVAIAAASQVIPPQNKLHSSNPDVAKAAHAIFFL
jgi:hypothetical protein